MTAADLADDLVEALGNAGANIVGPLRQLRRVERGADGVNDVVDEHVLAGAAGRLLDPRRAPGEAIFDKRADEA